MEKQLKMLLFCAVDMHYAAVAANAWVERREHDELHRVLQTAMIVTYARPFASSSFFNLKKAGFDYRPTDTRLADLHDRLLDMRDHAVAHTDEPAKSGRQIAVGMSDAAVDPTPGMIEDYEVLAHDMVGPLLELFESQKKRFEIDAVRLMREFNQDAGAQG
jgi:hypothetical protein